MADPIILKNVRLAYPNLKQARSQKQDDGSDGIAKYDAVLLIDRTTDEGKATLAELKAEVLAAAKVKWPEQYQTILPMLRDQARLCYKDGPHYTSDGNLREGWEDRTAVNVFRYADRGAPGLFAADKSNLGNDPAGVIYAGCYVNAKVNVFAWDHPKYGKRVRCELLALQFAGKGDAFGGASVPDAEGFEDLSASVPAGAALADDDIPF